MQELFLLAYPNASHKEQVERAVMQFDPTFATHLRSDELINLNELALKAKRVESNTPTSRSYRLYLPAPYSLEERCPWRGDSPFSMPHGLAVGYAASRNPNAPELSEISNPTVTRTSTGGELLRHQYTKHRLRGNRGPERRNGVIAANR